MSSPVNVSTYPHYHRQMYATAADSPAKSGMKTQNSRITYHTRHFLVRANQNVFKKKFQQWHQPGTASNANGNEKSWQEKEENRCLTEDNTEHTPQPPLTSQRMSCWVMLTTGWTVELLAPVGHSLFSIEQSHWSTARKETKKVKKNIRQTTNPSLYTALEKCSLVHCTLGWPQTFFYTQLWKVFSCPLYTGPVNHKAAVRRMDCYTIQQNWTFLLLSLNSIIAETVHTRLLRVHVWTVRW